MHKYIIANKKTAYKANNKPTDRYKKTSFCIICGHKTEGKICGSCSDFLKGKKNEERRTK